MEALRVAVTIRNPADPDRFWRGLFLVGTGATDSLAPGRRLEAIGLAPKGRRIHEPADGNEIAMDIATGDLEFMGETVGGTILFGADDAEPLLGLTALASAGVEIDPRDGSLKRRPAVRLKGLRTKAYTPGSAGFQPASTVLDTAHTAAPSRHSRLQTCEETLGAPASSPACARSAQPLGARASSPHRPLSTRSTLPPLPSFPPLSA